MEPLYENKVPSFTFPRYNQPEPVGEMKPVKVQHCADISKISTIKTTIQNFRTGRIMTLARKTALLLSGKYPKEFKIK